MNCSNNPGQSRSIEVKEFHEKEFNCLCPIKLLLCHALRTGAVYEGTWNDLRQASKERPSHRVVWVHPERPVICAIAQSRELIFDKPSPYQAAADALNEGSRLVGIIPKLSPHDIRRGAAREAAHINGSNLGAAVEQARLTIGHSAITASPWNGDTEDYIGVLDNQMWEKRVRNPLKPATKHRLDFTPNLYEPKPKRPKMDIEFICNDLNLDPSLPTDRAFASRQSSKADIDSWRAREKVSVETRQPFELRNDSISRGQESFTPGSMIANVATGSLPPVDCGIIDAEPEQFAQFFSSFNVVRWLHTVAGLPASANQVGSKDPPTRLMYHCTVDSCERVFPNPIARDAHAMACKAAVKKDFEFICTSCGEKYETQSKLDVHIKDCTWQPRRCPWPGCNDGTVHQNRSDLRLHTNQVHRDLPNQCWICDLELQSFVALKSHVKLVHPEVTTEELNHKLPKQKREAHKKNGFLPQRCSYPGCTSQQVFGTRKDYGGHLRSSHQARTDIDQYVQEDPEPQEPTTPPRTRAKLYTPQKCAFPGCPSAATFGERHKYAAHLKASHGVWKDEEVKSFIQDSMIPKIDPIESTGTVNPFVNLTCTVDSSINGIPLSFGSMDPTNSTRTVDSSTKFTRAVNSSVNRIPPTPGSMDPVDRTPLDTSTTHAPDNLSFSELRRYPTRSGRTIVKYNEIFLGGGLSDDDWEVPSELESSDDDDEKLNDGEEPVEDLSNGSDTDPDEEE